MLIVSANGRSSATTHAKGQLFVATRVFEVYPALAGEFGMRSPRDPFLHPTKGFHIQLIDERSNLVDEVGNLDRSLRTADEPHGNYRADGQKDGEPYLDHPSASQL